MAPSVDPDQTALSAASNVVLYCRLLVYKNTIRTHTCNSLIITNHRDIHITHYIFPSCTHSN